MALFGSKKKEKIVATKAIVAKTSANLSNNSSATAIIRPHITEKSGLLSQGGVYTFVITTGATKDTVAKAIRGLYKVTPVKVAITNLPSKNVYVRGKRGTVSGIRKAVVTVKKGDKIDFV